MCRKHGISEATYYNWKTKFGGMTVSDAQRLKALEAESHKLKRLLAETMLDSESQADLSGLLRSWVVGAQAQTQTYCRCGQRVKSARNKGESKLVNGLCMGWTGRWLADAVFEYGR